jgi:hypothetical protein
MARLDPDELERLIERILDAEPADWSTHADAGSGTQPEADALHTLADIARAFRRFGAPPTEPELFRWGSLRVLERVGAGACNEMFRAWDPALGVMVALKLLPCAASSSRARGFLDEARRLARVRSAGVRGVYGAAIHDARAGLWCEWIDGESLAERVARDGPFGVEETIVAGLALCRALGAVHGAGLLHGDVKPENVLRERGGRIVLIDLGAGGEPAAINAGLRSTASPAWLAPEVLHGALRAPQHDLYALGGVLHFLLQGERPRSDGVDAPARADIPAPLRALLARARAADPAQRFGDAAAFEQALLACLERARNAPAIPRRRRLLLGAAGAAIATVVVGLAIRAWHVPIDTSIELALLRTRGEVVEAIVDGAAVVVGDGLSFRLRSTRPVWLYAFNADDHGGAQRLFPLPGLDQSNPLAAGIELEIPGPVQGRRMRFEVSSQAAVEDFLVVAAHAPLARLEPSDAAPAAVRTRGTALVVPADDGLPATELDALARELDSAGGTRLWRFRLPHAADATAPRRH